MRLVLPVLLSLSLSGPLAAQPSQQRTVETNLLPAAVFDGKAEAWTIEQRMARWKVHGVGVAVVDDGKVVWARGYGVIAAGQDAPAASISKPVAAMAALALVQDGPSSSTLT